MRYFTLFLSMAVVGIGCEKTADIEGDKPGECSDRADNDQDGDYDCNDSDCVGSPDCQSADDSGDSGEDKDNDGYTESEGDCDDDNPNINPIVVDLVGDGIDQNCDGVDGMDFDGDGEASSVSGGRDCDDNEPNVNTRAEDSYADGIDQNCDGKDGPDNDGDGFVDGNAGGTDCDDSDDTSTHMGIDQDCDGAIAQADCDDTDAASTTVATDGDCDTILTADDCDDSDPNSTDVASDLDCDGVLNEVDCDDADPLVGATDADNDGFVDCVDDCDPSDPWTGPVDNDGDGFLACVDDCNDNNANAFPGAAENEQNAALCMLDSDQDGYGDTSVRDCVKLHMEDLWGDGWNGNQFDFEVDGTVVYTAELTAGYGAYEYICWEGLADIVLNKSTHLGEVRMTLSIQRQDIITLYGSSMGQTMDGAVVYSLDLSEYRPVYPGTDADDSDSSIH